MYGLPFAFRHMPCGADRPPATVWMRPSDVIVRTVPALLSTNQMVPSAAKASPVNRPRWASVARPPSPGVALPPPAMTSMMAALGARVGLGLGVGATVGAVEGLDVAVGIGLSEGVAGLVAGADRLGDGVDAAALGEPLAVSGGDGTGVSVDAGAGVQAVAIAKIGQCQSGPLLGRAHGYPLRRDPRRILTEAPSYQRATRARAGQRGAKRSVSKSSTATRRRAGVRSRTGRPVRASLREAGGC